LIDSSKSMEVVGKACSRSELLSDEVVADADVLLLDLDLAGESTANSLCSLRERCTGRVLVLTGTDDLEEHRRAVIREAQGSIERGGASSTYPGPPASLRSRERQTRDAVGSTFAHPSARASRNPGPIGIGRSNA
jgi:hypothetical protein